MAVFVALLLVVIAICVLLKPARTMFLSVFIAGVGASALTASAFRIADQWEKAVIQRFRQGLRQSGRLTQALQLPEGESEVEIEYPGKPHQY